MKQLLFAWLFLFVSFASAGPEPTAGNIYIGINADYTMPLVEVKNPLYKPEVERGILKDLGEAIAAELKRKPVWMLLPKKRVAPALTSGDINIICHLNEVWQPLIEKDVLWSQEIYISSSTLVHLAKKDFSRVKDLYGERVGTVLNFIYPSLEDAFEKKKLVREDGPNNEANIRKLLHGRIDYIVMSNLEYDFYKSIYANLEEDNLKMDAIQTKCALSKKSKITLEELNRAISTIKKNGTLERILKSY